MALTAATVSRQLRKAGFLPSSPERQYKHEGLFVRNGGLRGQSRVSVHIDIELPGKRERLATDIEKALHALGYKVERNPSAEAAILHVTKPEPPKAEEPGNAVPAKVKDVLDQATQLGLQVKEYEAGEDERNYLPVRTWIITSPREDTQVWIHWTPSSRGGRVGYQRYNAYRVLNPRKNNTAEKISRPAAVCWIKEAGYLLTLDSNRELIGSFSKGQEVSYSFTIPGLPEVGEQTLTGVVDEVADSWVSVRWHGDDNTVVFGSHALAMNGLAALKRPAPVREHKETAPGLGCKCGADSYLGHLSNGEAGYPAHVFKGPGSIAHRFNPED